VAALGGDEPLAWLVQDDADEWRSDLIDRGEGLLQPVSRIPVLDDHQHGLGQ
jgi:hypothetical protein